MQITKREPGEQLWKIESELGRHLKLLRQVAPESAKVVARHLFIDTMVPGVGNKLAYTQDFLSRDRPGVHVMIDFNDFGVVNKLWGQSVGDEAIQAMGGAISRASRSNSGKLYRVGGDEFRAHFDKPEQAHAFVRRMREELDQLPPIMGQHRHSVSVGLADSPDQAEQALIHAKNAKKAAGRPPGQAKNHAHSLLPGSAGPVPVGDEPEIPDSVKNQAPLLRSPIAGAGLLDPMVKKSERAPGSPHRKRKYELLVGKLGTLAS
jgi:diguanylate cyclase (GGDEF)-like protein